MVTGGTYSDTTEILQDQNWTVLKDGNLPVPALSHMNLATIDNMVFSFGKIFNLIYLLFTFTFF